MTDKNITIYAYKLSKTNTTLGFVNIKLHEVSELYEVRDRYFLDKTSSILTDKQIKDFESIYTFEMACQFGAIGLKALEPSKLGEYVYGYKDKRPKAFKITDEQSNQQFHIFKLWIYAMLNKSELLEVAGQIAAILHDFESNATRGKASNKQLSEEVRNAVNLRIFIDKLSELIGLYPLAATDAFHEKLTQVIKMPGDQFPLFVTLIRFEYSFQQSQQSIQ